MRITQEGDLITVEKDGIKVELVGDSYEQAIECIRSSVQMSFKEYCIHNTSGHRDLIERLNGLFVAYTDACAKADELYNLIGVDVWA